ncbi:MAG TPA: transposase [Nitrolancea sp.]|jgi:REP element-mobilizing transposase RayT|nr:transposase [Nitrolancea sp.]
MTYDPERHHRRTIRLREYDYAQDSAYFVTICLQDRSNILGDVVDGVMRANNAGQVVNTVWTELPVFYPGVDIDEFILMPNHIHGIVLLVGAATGGRPGLPATQGIEENDDEQLGISETESITNNVRTLEPGRPRGAAPTEVGLSLGDVVHRFKTMTTKRYADGVRQSGWTPFPGRLWQRDYYEHVIRDEASLNRIRRYIEENPVMWADDAENPLTVRTSPNASRHMKPRGFQ